MKKSTVSPAGERMTEVRDESSGRVGDAASALPMEWDGSLSSAKRSGLVRGESWEELCESRWNAVNGRATHFPIPCKDIVGPS